MTDTQPVSLGRRLRQERESRHWTQDQLAEKIGGSVPSINRYVRNTSSPPTSTLTLIIPVIALILKVKRQLTPSI